MSTSCSDNESPSPELNVSWQFINAQLLRIMSTLNDWHDDADLNRAFSGMHGANQWARLYTTVYNLCLANDRNARVLHTKLEETMRMFLRTYFLAKVKMADTSEFLCVYLKMYDKYWLLINWMSRTFSYVDRWHLKFDAQRRLLPLGMRCFFEDVFEPLKSDILKASIELIEKDPKDSRENSHFAPLCHLVRTLREHVRKVGSRDTNLYELELRTPLFQKLRKRYRKNANEVLRKLGFWSYLEYVEERLAEEKALLCSVLGEDAQLVSELIVDEYLIRKHTENFPEQFHRTLFATAEAAQLRQFVMLYSMAPGGSELVREAFGREMRSSIDTIAKEHEGSYENMMQVIPSNDTSNEWAHLRNIVSISYMKELARIWRAFYSVLYVFLEFYRVNDKLAAIRFARELETAFTGCLKETFPHMSCVEMLVRCFNHAIKMHGAGRSSEDEFNAFVVELAPLCVYVQDDEEFHQRYCDFLSTRMFLEGGCSADEVRVLNTICSHLEKRPLGLKKMTRVLEDVLRSQAHATGFARSLKRESKGPVALSKLWHSGMMMKATGDVVFAIHVLRSGAWPPYKAATLARPAQLLLFERAFESHFKDVSSDKKLTWHYDLSTVHVAASVFTSINNPIRVEIVGTVFQTCILMLFNDADELSVQNIVDALLDDVEENSAKHSMSLLRGKRCITAALRSLMTERFPLLICNGDNLNSKRPSEDSELTSSQLIRLNLEYQPAPEKIYLPSPSQFRSGMKTAGGDDVGEQEQIIAIESAIVRALKQNRTMAFTRVNSIVMKQISGRFEVRQALINSCIASLIERDYVCWDPEDKTVLRYVP